MQHHGRQIRSPTVRWAERHHRWHKRPPAWLVPERSYLEKYLIEPVETMLENALSCACRVVFWKTLWQLFGCFMPGRYYKTMVYLVF